MMKTTAGGQKKAEAKLKSLGVSEPPKSAP
jgi:hypothetical protein